MFISYGVITDPLYAMGFNSSNNDENITEQKEATNRKEEKRTNHLIESQKIIPSREKEPKVSEKKEKTKTSISRTGITLDEKRSEIVAADSSSMDSKASLLSIQKNKVKDLFKKLNSNNKKKTTKTTITEKKSSEIIFSQTYSF